MKQEGAASITESDRPSSLSASPLSPLLSPVVAIAYLLFVGVFRSLYILYIRRQLSYFNIIAL